MNKAELIDIVAKEADLSKAAAGKALDATLLGRPCHVQSAWPRR